MNKYSPRSWSNDQLRNTIARLAPRKSIINVSGWRDSDKEGSHYSQYFSAAENYVVSNYDGDCARGKAQDDLTDTISIDLAMPLDTALLARFDTAFSHTVLEHVENPAFAFEQISKLSSDIVITTVPFKQKLHFEPGQFGDYYRFTPFSMRQFHEACGLTILYESYTPPPSLDTYLFYVACHDQSQHSQFERTFPDIRTLNQRIGSFSAVDLVRNFVHRLRTKYL